MTRPSSSPECAGWLQIVIETHPVAEEAVGAFLVELGCEGICTRSGEVPAIEAYLPLDADQREIHARLTRFLQGLYEIFPETKPSHVTMKRLEDRDWSLEWRRFFRPEQVTPGLMIVPVWETVPATAEGHVIRMDPGPAFGTGQHATTRMCLSAMEDAVRANPWSMLDVGTGSGILAMYGALLGARRVVGIDIDPEALRWAERNIRLNGLQDRILLSGDPLDQWQETFSLVVANLTLGVILGLLSHLQRLTGPCGKLILSGILTDQVERVRDGLSASGFDPGRVMVRGEWACVTAKRHP
jgi:ribosomal protein L11 methyltransferase